MYLYDQASISCYREVKGAATEASPGLIIGNDPALSVSNDLRRLLTWLEPVPINRGMGEWGGRKMNGLRGK